jgi:hypothetical protein
MEDKQLTTEVEESHVDTETIATEVDEVSNDDQPVNDAGTDTNDTAYADAWDNIDINNFDVPDEVTTTEATIEEPQVDLNNVEAADVNDIKDTLNAFMTDKPVLKFKGKDVPVDSPDELIALAQKGFLLETEMGKIKPQKKLLNIIDGIPADVLQAVADLHGGNKAALNFLKSAYGITDTQPEESFFSEEQPTETVTDYKPEVKQADPVMEIWNDYIQNDPNGSGKVNEVYSQIDDTFKAEIYKPEVFPQFISSVVSGEFDNVYPIAMKEKAINPTLTWLQAYSLAAGKVGVQAPEAKKPTKSVETPTAQKQSRKVSQTAAYDRVWEDDSYFQELEKEIFKF